MKKTILWVLGLGLFIGCSSNSHTTNPSNPPVKTKWQLSDLSLLGLNLNEGACSDNRKSACDCILNKISEKYPDPIDFKVDFTGNPEKQKEILKYVRDEITPACKQFIPTPVPQPTMDPAVLNECKANIECVINNTTSQDAKAVYNNSLIMVEKGSPKEEIETLCNTVKISKGNFAQACK